jgi:cation transport ATPase
MKQHKNLGLIYYLISIIIMMISGFVSLGYGRSSYATITERSGIRGNFYIYYEDVSKAQYCIYTLIIASISGCFFLSQFILLRNKNEGDIVKSYWFFLAFIILFVVCEIILQSMFIGKG